jgi:hypothetical protein
MPGIADKFTQSAQGRPLWPGMTEEIDRANRFSDIQRLAAEENAVFVEATRRSLAAKSSIPMVAAAVEARMHARPTNQMRRKINSRGQSDLFNFSVDDRGAARRYRGGDTP